MQPSRSQTVPSRMSGTPTAWTGEQHQAALMAGAAEAVGRLSWPSARLAEYQQIRLRHLLAHAMQHSAFHRERLAGIDPTDFELSRLSELPTMTKTQMMARFEDVVTDTRLTRAMVDAHVAAAPIDMAYLLGCYVVMASGGSSGERGLFVYHHDEFTEFALGLLRPTLARLQALGVTSATPLTAALVAAPATVHGTGAVGALTGQHGGPVRMTRLSALSPLADLVAALEALQPALLVGYPSALVRLAHEHACGRLRIRPLAVSATSEALSPQARVQIEQAFGVAVNDTFGSSEGLCGVGERADHGICFASDACIIELVDAEHRPVAPGVTASKVLLTNLYNLTQPLIRYELTDRFVALPGPFADGHLRATVDGRHDEPFQYGAVLLQPLAIRIAMVRCPAVLEHQVLQTVDGIHARVVATPELDADTLRATLTHALIDAGLVDPLVTLEVVPTITRDTLTGKVRRFVPLNAH